MLKKQEEEDVRKATAVPTVPTPPSPAVKHRINEVLGWLVYLITAQQFLHVCIFATNFTLHLPSYFLSTLFPYHIDLLTTEAAASSQHIHVRPGELHTEFKRTAEAATHGYSYTANALFIDLALLAAVTLHHSLMARLPWQRMMMSFVPRWGERVSYVLASVFFFQLLFRNWVPLPQIMWELENPYGQFTMRLLCALGFVWVAVSLITAAVDDMFGFREAFTGKPAQPFPLRLHSVFLWSRMPIFFGILLCLWSASTMTFGRLLFASFFTLYTVIGGRFQERDMIKRFGRAYENYQKKVPFLVPLVPVF